MQILAFLGKKLVSAIHWLEEATGRRKGANERRKGANERRNAKNDLFLQIFHLFSSKMEFQMKDFGF